MKTILIPLDETDFSRRIFPPVQDFFSPQDYELKLLRVAKPPAGSAEVPRPVSLASGFVFDAQYEEKINSMAEQYRQDLETFKMAVSSELVADREMLQKVGYQVSATVHFGNPVDEIVNEVENGDISLVALATHGRKGLGRLLLGSVAESTLRKLTVPLFMIRPEED